MNKTTGGCLVVRRCPSLYVSNSVTTGAAQVTGLTGTSSLVVGSAISHPVFTGIYQVPFSFQFTLDNLAQYTDFTNFADQYCIKKVVIRAMYNANAVSGISASGALPSIVPSIKYVVDNDDASVPTVALIDAKMGVKVKSFQDGRLVKMSCRPKPLESMYNQGATTSAPAFSPAKVGTWVNSFYPGCVHYGIKGYIQNMSLQTIATLTSCITFDVEYTVGLKDFQ